MSDGRKQKEAPDIKKTMFVCFFSSLAFLLFGEVRDQRAAEMVLKLALCVRSLVVSYLRT